MFFSLFFVVGLFFANAYTCNQFRNAKQPNWYFNAGAEDAYGPCIYMPCTMGYWKFTKVQWTVFDPHMCNNATNAISATNAVRTPPKPVEIPSGHVVASVASHWDGSTHVFKHNTTAVSQVKQVSPPPNDGVFKCCLYSKASAYDISPLIAVGYNPLVHTECQSTYDGLPVFGEWVMNYHDVQSLYNCIIYEYEL
mmetsp:Transcript_43201/g.84674  ORF Transcript_43201/g.84674 Transcript_43201/m.84674 type:complete len:195 (+) Transcript_43201:36-620(+)